MRLSVNIISSGPPKGKDCLVFRTRKAVGLSVRLNNKLLIIIICIITYLPEIHPHYLALISADLCKQIDLLRFV